MSHRWESLLFLHWVLPPEAIQRTLPPGLMVDKFDGKAYLGIIPFFMRRVRLRGLPAIPGVSDFLELNVRTYVYDRSGVPGVWFYSLSCNQPVAVAGARLLTGLPYVNAEMTGRSGNVIDYSCRRTDTDEVARFSYRGAGVAAEAAVSSLEFFLLERYYLYAIRFGSLVRAQVAHAPYRYSGAQVEEWSSIPAQLDGFPGIIQDPIHVCHVSRLDVKVFATEKLSRSAEP